MWKLKIGEGGPWVKTCSRYLGRAIWEFDERLGSSEDRAVVERERREFHINRHYKKTNSDQLVRMQLAKENNFDYFKRACPEEKTASAAVHRAICFFSAIQAKDGHWPGDFDGVISVTPILIIVLYVMGMLHILSYEHQKELRRYMYNHQNEDGGWGLHDEAPSCMLCTALFYTALRLLGEEASSKEDYEAMYLARKWIHHHGGITMMPSWGKLILSVLGVYEWSGLNPMPPELFLLPSCLPIHPGKFWCIIRLNFLAMSYLYGKRFVGPITDTILSLREELHIQKYDTIDWNQARKTFSEENCGTTKSRFREFLKDCLYKFEYPLTIWPCSFLRKIALDRVEKYIKYEDASVRYIHLGAQEKSTRMLCSFVRDPNCEDLKCHLGRIPDFLWISEDGMRMKTYICSMAWDTALAIQAILACDFAKEHASTLRKAHDFLKASQIMDNPPGDFKSHFRSFTKGGWGFSTADEGWCVSDCTAEALKALLLLSSISPDIVGDHAPSGRIYEAVNFMLSLQNPDGGFSGWELTRSYPWVEVFNITEVYEDVMLDYSCVECTSSVIQALMLFKERYDRHRTKDIKQRIIAGKEYIKKTQNDDGSWFGSWGICYIYGTFFGIQGLLATGETYANCEAIRKACAFLLSKQLSDGGWGESYLSSTTKVYTNLPGNKSNVVQTAWSMLALLKAGQIERDPAPVDRAARNLIDMQLDNGDFPQQEMTGSFRTSGLLNYVMYRNIFPIWALGEYQKREAFFKTNI
ncbi:cycloartenol synthase-like [Carex rostrata]